MFRIDPSRPGRRWTGLYPTTTRGNAETRGNGLQFGPGSLPAGDRAKGFSHHLSPSPAPWLGHRVGEPARRQALAGEQGGDATRAFTPSMLLLARSPRRPPAESGTEVRHSSPGRRPGYKFHPRGRCKTRPVIDLLRFVSGLAADLVRRRVEFGCGERASSTAAHRPKRKIAGRIMWTPWQRFTIVLAVRIAPAWREATLLIRPRPSFAGIA